jgi:parallel beta-helix repeat protein
MTTRLRLLGQKNLEFDATPYNEVIIQDCEHITIRNCSISSNGRPQSVRISTSKNVRLENCSVTGNLTDDAHGVHHTGISVTSCQDVSIRNCQLERNATGISLRRCDGVTISGSRIEKGYKDSLLIGSDVCNLIVEGNTFVAQDVRVYTNEEHHYDTIQWWVRPDATKHSENFLIENNTLIDLTGSVRPQCIFGGVRGSPRPLFRLKNLVVRHNRIAFQHTHGITADGVDGLHVYGNMLVYAGTKESPEPKEVPSISWSDDCTDVHVYGNVMPYRWPYTRRPETFWLDNFIYYPTNGQKAPNR